MGKPLLEYSTKELLEKFGAGGHKPGSGSAAALQGLLSAQLLRTVIELTCDPKRQKQYSLHAPRFAEIKQRIELGLYPSLDKLLHEDAVYFDEAINARRMRESQTDPEVKRQLAAEAVEKLKPAIKIPLMIANRCIELARFACFAFDHGFQSARGDTCVSLNAAISAIFGCVSIVDLNLLSFESDPWTDAVRKKLASLRMVLNELTAEARAREQKLATESDRKGAFFTEIAAIATAIKGKRGIHDRDIEQVANRLQRALWRYRDVHWKGAAVERHAAILDPVISLKLMHFRVDVVPTLGQHVARGVASEIAGQIDQRTKVISVSEQFRGAIRNFTVAHELGHALMHQQTVLHRDVPIDGAHRQSTDIVERQADSFAKHFLMPKKLVEKIFAETFSSRTFVIDEFTARALSGESPSELRKRCKGTRGLSRLLATADSYAGQVFNYSLSTYFGVSPEAMAIRLEELELLAY